MDKGTTNSGIPVFEEEVKMLEKEEIMQVAGQTAGTDAGYTAITLREGPVFENQKTLAYLSAVSDGD